MDYYQKVDRALKYIEANLKDDLDLGEVAEQAYCSLFYFHRIFSSLMGDPLKSYIRMRRMSEAAKELVDTDRRVIDIAMDFGFGSQEAFTRSFQSHYNLTPGRFRKQGHSFALRSPKTIEQLKTDSLIIKGEAEPVIEELSPFSVVGRQMVTRHGGPNFKDIPLFWSRYLENDMASKVRHRKEPWRCYGICLPIPGEKSRFAYLAAEEVDRIDDVPGGYVSRTVPGGTYARFESRGPLPETLQRVVLYAYGRWLPSSTEWERADSEDFELYDARVQGDPPVSFVYIPVKPMASPA